MFIFSEHTDSIGTLTLNQPAKRNALSEALADFQRAGRRVVVIRPERRLSGRYSRVPRKTPVGIYREIARVATQENLSVDYSALIIAL